MVFETLHQNTFKRILNQEWFILVPKLCCRHRIPMVQNRVSWMLRSAYPIINFSQNGIAELWNIFVTLRSDLNNWYGRHETDKTGFTQRKSKWGNHDCFVLFLKNLGGKVACLTLLWSKAFKTYVVNIALI